MCRNRNRRERERMDWEEERIERGWERDGWRFRTQRVHTESTGDVQYCSDDAKANAIGY
jgi:hypothetical protein